jgi:assimilatory nitrate reductase catalytic subunit
MSNRAVRTTCPYCGVGCGIIATRQPEGAVAIDGDLDHPANFGRLCSKGKALAETLSLDDRVLHPLIHGVRANWDEAIDLIAKSFSETIAAHGSDSVAFYVSGQLLTEDYYVANKLMKGFIGSANIDTNSRLCMASSVAGHRRAFGADTVPGCYQDLECADLIVLVGSNLAWCHPVLFQRIAAARAARNGLPRVVVIDPRWTATCEIADLHLAIAPDTDVALFNGLLAAIVGGNATSAEFVREHTSGFDAAAGAAKELPLGVIARITRIGPRELADFYDLFIRTERVVTIYSQGVNQSASGTDKVNAIINCHLATARIGKPGMGPLSVTGQPNAMGGREVGGLATMLAAHMDIDNAAHRAIVQAFWSSPRIATKPGLKAVEMFRAVGDGRIKAIWIMATNPVDSMPDSDTVRAALESCPFVVVSDVTRHTDTTQFAHVLLPSLAWGEKDGTVTNSERRISRQRAFLPSPGEARADWWQLAKVATRMGWGAAFSYTSSAAIFDEHARLSAAANDGTRDFDIGALARLQREDYDAMAPVQWPRRTLVAADMSATPTPASAPASHRFFSDGRFFTSDGRARFVPTPWRASKMSADDGSLVLNTGRIRDQWHTMTRTAKSPRLMSHTSEPFVELHPDDARRIGLAVAEIARISSGAGRMLARVVITERQQRGSAFVPMHWTDQLARNARVNAAIEPGLDLVSGQPGLKQARATLDPFPVSLYGVAVTRHAPPHLDLDYQVMAPIGGGWRIELATADENVTAQDLLYRLLGPAPPAADDVIAYLDRATGQTRLAAFDGNCLSVLLYASSRPVAASRSWLAEQLAAEPTARSNRLQLLAGRPGSGQRDPGPIVCACLEVGLNDIHGAIDRGATSLDLIGSMTKAGTNCGSCRTEIGRVLDAARHAKAG